MSTICLGMLLGLPHLEMAGWGCIYSPQHKYSRWRKVLLSASNRTVRWCTGQRTVACPVRLAVALSEQVTVGATGFPHRTVRWSSLRVPPGTSRWATVSWCTGQSGVFAPDSPVLHAQTVRRQHTWTFLRSF
jgi:hypothetical protein